MTNPALGHGGDWLDGATHKPLVVWARPDAVAIYEGEKTTATRRRLLTPDEADTLADILHGAAQDVRDMQRP